MPAGARSGCERRFGRSYRRFRLWLIHFAPSKAKNSQVGRVRFDSRRRTEEPAMTGMTDEQTMTTWDRVRHELMAIVLLTLLLLVMALLSAPVASATDEPKLQNNGAVQYLSGGIGKEEADALKQQSADYALTL